MGRFESVSTDPDTTNQMSMGVMDIMQLRKYFNQNTKQMWTGIALGSVPRNDLYMRYCIMAESDVWAGINETGMKLLGFSQPDWGFGPMSTIMWHSIPGSTNPYHPPYSLDQPIRLTTYFHGGDLNAGSAYGYDWIKPPTHDNIYLQPDRWTCIEQHMVMNSMQPDGTGNHDGLLDVWIDDELVLSFRNIKIRDYDVSGAHPDPVEIQQLHGQIYHGGMYHAPLHPIHYRITGVAVAKRRIGMPQRVN